MENEKVYASGYSEAGASTTRRALRGFIASSGSPVKDIDSNNSTLRKRSRLLYMSSPVATSAINTVVTKAVGVGLKLEATLDYKLLGLTPEKAKEWQSHTEAEFELWSSDKRACDALGLNDWTTQQQLSMRSALMNGDVAALIVWEKPTAMIPYGMRVHLIEADRIRTPYFCGGRFPESITEGKVPEGKPGAGNIVHDGIEVDKNGKVVAFWIADHYPDAISFKDTEYTRVLAYGEKTGLPNVIFVRDPERCEQYRGVPYLAQVIESLLQLRRYTESELVAAIVQSLFTAFVETDSPNSDNPLATVGAGQVGGVPVENPQVSMAGDREIEMSPGNVVHLKPGEKVQFGSPNIPSTGFDSFVDSYCRLIGAALGLPKDVLMKEYNESYSASRAALLDAWEMLRMRRSWFVREFIQPIYRIWLSEAVARGRISAPGFFTDPLRQKLWCGAEWIGPVQGQIDPVKEVTAATLQTKAGFKTHAQVTRELGGGDFEENCTKLQQENEMLANTMPAEPVTE